MAWANTDTLGHYAIGVSLCAADFGSDADPDLPDGMVGVIDLQLVLTHFGTINDAYDLDDDGVVGILDLLIVLGAWGTCR